MRKSNTSGGKIKRGGAFGGSSISNPQVGEDGFGCDHVAPPEGSIGANGLATERATGAERVPQQGRRDVKKKMETEGLRGALVDGARSTNVDREGWLPNIGEQTTQLSGKKKIEGHMKKEENQVGGRGGRGTHIKDLEETFRGGGDVGERKNRRIDRTLPGKRKERGRGGDFENRVNSTRRPPPRQSSGGVKTGGSAVNGQPVLQHSAMVTGGPFFSGKKRKVYRRSQNHQNMGRGHWGNGGDQKKRKT